MGMSGKRYAATAFIPQGKIPWFLYGPKTVLDVTDKAKAVPVLN
jgi:hypothetical protein